MALQHLAGPLVAGLCLGLPPQDPQSENIPDLGLGLFEQAALRGVDGDCLGVQFGRLAVFPQHDAAGVSVRQQSQGAVQRVAADICQGFEKPGDAQASLGVGAHEQVGVMLERLGKLILARNIHA